MAITGNGKGFGAFVGAGGDQGFPGKQTPNKQSLGGAFKAIEKY